MVLCSGQVWCLEDSDNPIAEAVSALTEHPILDESDWSDREMEDMTEQFNDWGWREWRDLIVRLLPTDADREAFEDREDAIDWGALWYEAGEATGSYAEHGGQEVIFPIWEWAAWYVTERCGHSPGSLSYPAPQYLLGPCEPRAWQSPDKRAEAEAACAAWAVFSDWLQETGRAVFSDWLQETGRAVWLEYTGQKGDEYRALWSEYCEWRFSDEPAHTETSRWGRAFGS